ncbi:tetratricopeptide repeat protein [Leptospira kanakyensis]|uniref:Tetratricopeptide repeat protein n=1 Tax=Leptospira kanakyensis TaxID=2484968 RepID=A0A6N4Q8M6_9LEPT|nr:tetratricopeptide repeat protein [Leptospira kanakyensis]TGK52021.1 tetratricopeptide repeat protein [Leptospira kanakyensis]TGK57070.1 tetratricopeptide repeat protein [Leptospira kanakyensis]TGK71913.1 tetratricopeptide repeat protein [Leptospira kanakyensis]
MDSQKIIEIRNLAEIAKSEGRNTEAIALMKEYLSLVHPSFTHYSWYFIADLYFQEGKIEEAMEHCNEALRLNNDYIPGLELRITLFKKLDRWEEAIKDKEKIEKLNAIEKSKWDDPNHYYHYK